MVCRVVHFDFVCYVLLHQDFFIADYFFSLTPEESFLSLTKLRRYEWNYIDTRLIVKRFEGRTKVLEMA